MNIYIGLDLGGSSLKYGYGNKKQGIKKFNRKLIDQPNRDNVSTLLILTVEELMNELSSYYKIGGISLGSPGFINSLTGEISHNSPNIADWVGFNPKEMLAKKFSIPVYLENDADLMALGESQARGKLSKSLLGITIGSGIGSGFIYEGQIFRGSNYAALELGHTIVEPNGKNCLCGKKGCVEAYSSVKSILSEINRTRYTNSAFSIEEALQATIKDPTISSVFLNAYKKLGLAIANGVMILDPEVIVIGGGLTECPNFKLEPLAEAVKANLDSFHQDRLIIEKAHLQNRAGVWGGIINAEEQLETKDPQ